MSNLLKKVVMGAIASAALCAAATPASAVVVRDASGILQGGYTQWAVEIVAGGVGTGVYAVTVYDPLSAVACNDATTSPIGFHCRYWVPGYTVTGNGYEVTKP